MAVTIEQVPRWFVSQGIGHAVGQLKGGFIYVGCRSMFSGNEKNTTKRRPKRVCRKCRESLKNATIVTK